MTTSKRLISVFGSGGWPSCYLCSWFLSLPGHLLASNLSSPLAMQYLYLSLDRPASLFIFTCAATIVYITYKLVHLFIIKPYRSPLRLLPGPPPDSFRKSSAWSALPNSSFSIGSMGQYGHDQAGGTRRGARKLGSRIRPDVCPPKSLDGQCSTIIHAPCFITLITPHR